MSSNVFKEDPLWLDFADDAGNVWPEVAFVVGPLALSRHAEGLARVSGEDGIEGATEGPTVEGRDIIPDRGRGKLPVAHGRDEGLAGIVLPFDKASRMESRLCKQEAHIQAPAASAQG